MLSLVAPLYVCAPGPATPRVYVNKVSSSAVPSERLWRWICLMVPAASGPAERNDCAERRNVLGKIEIFFTSLT